MANGVFEYAKGRFAEKASLPLGTDALVVVLLQSSGLDADSTLKNFQYLDALLGGNTEASFTNYARKIVNSGITVTTSTSSAKTTVDMADWTWSAAGGGTNNTLGKLIVCYRKTSSALDSEMLNLSYHDFSATTTGSDLLAQIASTGLSVAA